MRKSQIIALVVIIVMLIPSVIILCDFIGWHNTMTFVQTEDSNWCWHNISSDIYSSLRLYSLWLAWKL